MGISAISSIEGKAMAIKVVPKPARLGWRNFRPVAVIPGSDEDAQVAPEAVLPKRVGMKKVSGKFQLTDFTLVVSLDTTDTMVVRSTDRTPELLEHEQGHFDLMLLSARALAADLEALEADSPEDLQSAVSSAHETHGDRATAVDKEYDTQTDHSRNVAQQRRWRKLIDEALGKQNVTQIDGNDL
jgi:hypothetical protein